MVEEGVPLSNDYGSDPTDELNFDFDVYHHRSEYDDDTKRSTLSKQVPSNLSNSTFQPNIVPKIRTHLVVGGNNDHKASSGQEHNMDIDDTISGTFHEFHDAKNEVTHMEGVEAGPQVPLIVFDGANVAYAYSEAKATLYDDQGFYSSSSLSSSVNGYKRQPDVEGINIAVNYFLGTGQCRVMVVLPSYWLRAKPSDSSRDNAKMQTPELDSLLELKNNGLLCCAPPRDDDDAYIISIARRSDRKARACGGGGSFILSNDMYRDAIERDNKSSGLKEWLNGNNMNRQGPARISYTFCDLGTMNEFGSRILDFVPNPSHPFIQHLDGFQNYR